MPPEYVLDLFAVPDDVQPLAGGQGGSVLAGDLVLSPGRDAQIQDLLSPQLARLAVDLDTRSGRRPRDLRIAMPVPARDGAWVVEGWAASRYEPGTTTCGDLPVLRATAALLHAEFARAFAEWPLAHEEPRSPWDVGERVAFGDSDRWLVEKHSPTVEFVDELLTSRDSESMGADQLVHGDIAGNVLLDAAGAPVVIDVAPYWRPHLWSEAVCVLDAVMWGGADPAEMAEWAAGPRREAMIRAGIFRLVADQPEDPAPYRQALAALSRP